MTGICKLAAAEVALSCHVMSYRDLRFSWPWRPKSWSSGFWWWSSEMMISYITTRRRNPGDRPGWTCHVWYTLPQNNVTSESEYRPQLETSPDLPNAKLIQEQIAEHPTVIYHRSEGPQCAIKHSHNVTTGCKYGPVKSWEELLRTVSNCVTELRFSLILFSSLINRLVPF